VIDRGTCTFLVKALNAQNNGAIGAIIINNVAGALAPGGTDPTITIPVMGLTQADGTALKAAIGGGVTTVTMRLHPTKRSGMHASGHVRMFAPNPFQSGSSVSHFDVTLTPNAIMEPSINADLTSSVDLTVPLFRDIGWIPRPAVGAGCGASSRVALASSPNPTRGDLTVNFDLAAEENVELALFDVSGRLIRSLAKGRYAAGPHRVTWDGRDARGRTASPGRLSRTAEGNAHERFADGGAGGLSGPARTATAPSGNLRTGPSCCVRARGTGQGDRPRR
jgi:hypothetical protein